MKMPRICINIRKDTRSYLIHHNHNTLMQYRL